MKVQESETAENILRMIKSILSQHQIPESRIASVTSDHASNMIAALNATPWNAVGCFAHMINLRWVEPQVKKLSSCIKMIRKSPAAFRRLKVPPVKYIQTRWSSLGKTVSWICDHHNDVNDLLRSRAATQSNSEHFNEDEIQLFQGLRRPFELLNEYLATSQGEKYVTASLAFPLLRQLHDQLLPSQQSSTSFTSSTLVNAVNVAIRASIDHRWEQKSSKEKHLIRCAILLDPRMRSIEERDDVIEHLHRLVLDEMSTFARPLVDKPEPQPDSLSLMDLLSKGLQARRYPTSDREE